jgi:hypothetical protein
MRDENRRQESNQERGEHSFYTEGTNNPFTPEEIAL